MTERRKLLQEYLQWSQDPERNPDDIWDWCIKLADAGIYIDPVTVSGPLQQ